MPAAVFTPLSAAGFVRDGGLKPSAGWMPALQFDGSGMEACGM